MMLKGLAILAIAAVGVSGQPKWYTPFEQPDGMLVIVGIITCFVIGWQSWATRKAAKAAEDSADAALKSVRLQEAQMRQWVETTDEWDVRTDYHVLTAIGTTLRISFGVVNPTQWPLTLTRIRVRVENETRDESFEQTLGPQEFHQLREFAIPLGGQIFDWFKASGFDAEVSLDVWFIDNLREHRTQSMDFICKCFSRKQHELHFRPRTQRDEAYARQKQRTAN
jgi:hypothetical protein